MIVLVHPMLASGRAMAPLASALGGEARMPDLPSHGAAAAFEGGDYLRACLAALGPLSPDADLVGHSYGGVVALAAALAAPVRSVTVIEPVLFAAMGAEGFAAYDAEMAAFTAAIGAGDMERAARSFHAVWGEGPWDALPPRAREAIVARIHLIPASGGALMEDAHALDLSPVSSSSLR